MSWLTALLELIGVATKAAPKVKPGPKVERLPLPPKVPAELRNVIDLQKRRDPKS